MKQVALPDELAEVVNPLLGKAEVTRQEFLDACRLGADVADDFWDQRKTIANILYQLWKQHANLNQDPSLNETAQYLKKLRETGWKGLFPEKSPVLHKAWRDAKWAASHTGVPEYEPVAVQVTANNVEELIYQPAKARLLEYEETIKSTIKAAFKRAVGLEKYDMIVIVVFPSDYGVSIFAETSDHGDCPFIGNPFENLPRKYRFSMIEPGGHEYYEYGDDLLDIEANMLKIFSEYFTKLFTSDDMKSLIILPVYICIQDDEEILLIEKQVS